MKALKYHGPYKVSVDEAEMPRLEAPTDAILRITSAAICGSDLHMYDGRTDLEPGMTLGHEIMGVIDSVGNAVTQIKPGDRVVLPFNIACGACRHCSEGYTNACLTLNPKGVGAGYGYADMGPYQGGQAEYVRVPHVDVNALKLPGTPGDELEDDFLMLADILPTAFHSTELAKVKIGSSVAIYGAGPVGLLAAMSAQLKGTSEIYVVDEIPDRLELARKLGAVPINFRDGDPVGQIEEIRKSNKRLQQSLRPGEEKLKGVMSGIDAIGFQAHEFAHPDKERPTQVIEDLARLVNPGGAIGIIGVFMPQDPGGIDPDAKQGDYEIPWGELWHKGIKVGTGQCPVKQYNYQLRDVIMAGKAKPSMIVSHRIPIDEAPDAYAKFDKRADGYTKVVLKPGISV